jgi:hypothetical protein
MAFVPFNDADAIGDRFLALLSKHDIQPPSGSSLEDELLSLTQLIEVTKNPALAQGVNGVAILRAAAGLHDFAAKVLSVEPIAEFSEFLPHLRLIAQTKVAAASFAQNMPSAYNDDTARKMAELYMGCLGAHVGTSVELDSPTNARGDNPDVMFMVQESDPDKQPQKWALAIKAIGTKQGQTIFENIKKGAEQINRCPAEKGMVVINAKSVLDHDALWNTAFPDLSSAISALGEQLDTLADSANQNRPQKEWDAAFSGKAVRPVLFLGQSLVRLPTQTGHQLPTALKMLKAYDANGSLDSGAHGLADGLNHFMQTVLRGIPGGNGVLPQ